MSVPRADTLDFGPVAGLVATTYYTLDARATVAITRAARSLCLIMGPLDMNGLLGAAAMMGTLMYGARHVWAGRANFYLHDQDLCHSPKPVVCLDTPAPLGQSVHLAVDQEMTICDLQ